MKLLGLFEHRDDIIKASSFRLTNHVMISIHSYLEAVSLETKLHRQMKFSLHSNPLDVIHKKYIAVVSTSTDQACCNFDIMR